MSGKVIAALVVGCALGAAGGYITDQPMGALAKGMLTRHMAHTMVAVQGKSRAAALDILLQDQAKVDGECLDGAHIKADPLGLWSKPTM